jgi:hypothetical protein
MHLYDVLMVVQYQMKHSFVELMEDPMVKKRLYGVQMVRIIKEIIM